MDINWEMTVKPFLLLPLGLLAAPALAQTQTAPAPAPAPAPATTPAPAAVQTGTPQAAAAPTAAATPTAGATVYDSTGQVIGTIDSVSPSAIVINTGTNKVGVPPSGVGSGPKGLQMAMTKAQLDAAATQSQAALASNVAVGAEVKGAGGTPVGTIKAVDAQNVTITTPKGDVKLPANAVGARADGVYISLTAEQLDAAIGQAAPAATSAGKTTTTTKSKSKTTTAQ